MEKVSKLSTEIKSELIDLLKNRFEKNMARHADLKWDALQKNLEASDKLLSLYEMERTGGEPDVIAFDPKSKEFLFVDCSPESPIGRRSVCYDRAGLESRKDHKPENSAIDMATTMGIEILNEEQYSQLQLLGEFDTKTSSWIQTPVEIRKLGGALFGDFRYGKVFVYHNGAQSYYSARGFRGCVRV